MQENEGPREPAAEVWKSLNEAEERRMTPMMSMTSDQVCARARRIENGNLWAHWIEAAVLLFLLTMLSYNVFHISQPWIRLGQAWMLGWMLFIGLAMLGRGPRRKQVDEPCANFLEREFETRRDGYLGLRRALFLLIPGIAATWWGVKLRGLRVDPSSQLFHVDPSSRLFHFAAGPWPYLFIGVALVLVWLAFGHEAGKAGREVERIRQAIRS
jgi:hypothetical protein